VLALEMADFWLSGKWQSSTATVTPVVTGSQILPPATPRYKSWTVNCADSDTLIVFPHGFQTDNSHLPLQPDDVRITPIPSYANAALPNWAATADTTNIYLAKQSATGSGASPALKVTAATPHSIVH